MDEVIIPRDEYLRLKGFEAVIGQIEKVIHKQELSDETKKALAEARATPKEDYISSEEMEKEFS